MPHSKDTSDLPHPTPSPWPSPWPPEGRQGRLTKGRVKKVMLFAAGRGERMRPLTDKKPKPLLPLGDKTLIDYSLFYLKRYGVEEVVINLCYLGERIEHYVGDGKKYGLKIHYSKEEKLLGTGGGLKKAEDFFKNEENFITLNSDTLINCDLNELAQFHEKEKTPATIVVAPWQEGYTRVQAGNNQLFNVGAGDYLFTGLTILSPKIFEVLPQTESNLILDGIVPLMQQVKKIAAFIHEGYWRDIGSQESYEAAQEEWAANHLHRLP